ncbi:AI-2E family transporter [Aureimonas populi]|uniref:AI-2E family transporter n=1 Tax=Aureimonas populi TaxID=1701758 RepID=A0ABW5CPQ7_9HYPH|nr:AI-2E family transporter [Aureimonas populi]
MSLSSSQADLAYKTVTVAGIVLAMAVGVLVLYFAASAFFILFASFVVAAVFDGAARGLAMLGVPRKLGLVIVFLVTLAAVAALAFFGGATLVTQAGQLFEALREQSQELMSWLAGVLPAGVEAEVEAMEPSDLQTMMPDAGGVVSSASTAVFSVLGGITNFFIILFLAAFVVWQPGVYRRGLVSLFPKEKRARIAQTTDASAHSLRMWLLGEAISMVTVFAVSWLGLWLIDMPYAFLLALQAGLLAFVPTLGALVAGVPIVLTGLSVSPTMALLGLGVYVVIQGVESNITTPIAQRWATSLPPALTLSVQLIFGLIFGLAGFILAVPLMAVLMVVIRMLYVEDVLGGGLDKDGQG